MLLLLFLFYIYCQAIFYKSIRKYNNLVELIFYQNNFVKIFLKKLIRMILLIQKIIQIKDILKIQLSTKDKATKERNTLYHQI